MNKLANILITLMFLSATVNAQSDCFPINSLSGQAEIRGRVRLEGKTKDEIFTKCLVWGTSKASSQENVIKDREAGIYKMYLQINYDYKGGFRTMFYAITLQANEGYFEYTLNDYTMNKKPMEEFLRLKASDQVYNSAFADICTKMNYTLNGLKAIE